MPTTDERETIINIPNDGSKASVYTWRKPWWKRCEKAGWTLIAESHGHREYQGDPKSIFWRIKHRSGTHTKCAKASERGKRLAEAMNARKTGQ